jgi:Uma2 family endonuclease
MASPYNPDEYLAAERESPVRHEYLQGQIYTMAGDNLPHSQICVNLIAEIGQQLRATSVRHYRPT